jgi:hypothetical protein
MSKIVLLTSCNTVVNTQNLTYAIVQWLTGFLSEEVSKRSAYRFVGPQIKGVAPSEESVQLANRNCAVASMGRVIKATSVPDYAKGQVKRQRRILPSTSHKNEMISTPPPEIARSKMPHEQHQENSVKNGNPRLSHAGRVVEHQIGQLLPTESFNRPTSHYGCRQNKTP